MDRTSTEALVDKILDLVEPVIAAHVAALRDDVSAVGYLGGMHLGRTLTVTRTDATDTGILRSVEHALHAGSGCPVTRLHIERPGRPAAVFQTSSETPCRVLG